jgi:hypothetical protein
MTGKWSAVDTSAATKFGGHRLSWVTDVVLLASLAERSVDGGELSEPKALEGINAWLGRGGWAPLVSAGDTFATEKAFQACAYGGALNRLDIPGFLKAVAAQPWREKAGVLLLVKDESDTAFTPYRLSPTGSVLKIM